MSRVLLPLLVLGLSGCWVTSEEIEGRLNAIDTDVDTDTDSDTEPLDPLALTAVDPDVGNNRGGTLVTLEVGPLDPETPPEVTFGGVPGEVQSHSAAEVVVRAPAVGVEGRVDVVVTDRGRNARASSAFYYWADGSGRVGMLGTVANYDLDRGYDLSDYFGGIEPGHPSEMHAASVLYTEPVDTEWWKLYAPALDVCARDFRYDGPTINFLTPEVDRIVLDPDDEQLELFPDGNGEFYGVGLTEGYLPTSRGLTLSQDRGGPGWVAMDVTDAVRLPSPGFRVTSPAADFTEGTIDPSFELRWEGGVPGDVVLVEMYRYDFLGDFQDEVTCALVDDGSFTVGSSVWSNRDPFGGHVAFRVGRARLEDATLPTNAARVGVYGLHWWYGAAWFRI